MEYLPTVHEHSGELTGAVLPRADVIKDAAWCMSTNVFVMNGQGHILCHQRSKNKERFPGAWSTHLGGHVGHGETFESNAHKEFMEESGVKITEDALIPWRVTKIPQARLWVKEFVVFLDVPVEHFTPQPGEVELFAWRSPEEIMALEQSEPGSWLAGTHDFKVEYHCLRAAINAARSALKLDQHPHLLKWLA